MLALLKKLFSATPGTTPHSSATLPKGGIRPGDAAEQKATIATAHKAPQPRPANPPQPPGLGDNWRQFFQNTHLHQSGQGVLAAFVETWPDGLDPKVFAALDISALLSRVREYQTMPYPIKALAGLGDARPDYRMVDGKIARASNMFLDMILCQVAPLGDTLQPGEQPGHVVMRLVQRYSTLPLAQLLFLLPRTHDASEAAKAGKAAVVVVEDLQIQVYKGVENLLFDVYEGLPEGGRLTDARVREKLLSLLMPTG